MTRRSSKDVAEYAEKKLGVNIFSAEYQIIFLLHGSDFLSVGQIAAQTKVSLATFQNKLKKLMSLGLIAWETDDSDSRRRKYRLSQYARSVLREELQFLGTWKPLLEDGKRRMDVKKFIQSIQKRLKIKLFSLEYHLIVGIYDLGPVYTVELQKWSDISPRSFHYTLCKLVNSGIVYKMDDGMDRRRKLNHLHGWVSDTLDELHRELKEWADNLPPR